MQKVRDGESLGPAGLMRSNSHAVVFARPLGFGWLAQTNENGTAKRAAAERTVLGEDE
jgi:hypothetical protein